MLKTLLDGVVPFEIYDIMIVDILENMDQVLHFNNDLNF